MKTADGGAGSPDLHEDDASCTCATTVVSVLPVALMSHSSVYKLVHVELCFAIRLWCVRFGTQVLESQATSKLLEVFRPITGVIVREQPTEANAEPSIVAKWNRAR